MASKASQKAPPPGLFALSDLDLDPRNPRFGGVGTGENAQSLILDRIVTVYGIGDVLSSLAVNGYFRAEPLVGRKSDNGRITIVEGNRRLAACLILAGDPRAANQQGLAEQNRSLWLQRGRPSIDPVPVILFENVKGDRELLSYLGVRHISASAPWDSYAKAAWVADVVDEASLTVAEVAQMVGDKHQTVARLLEGFYFMQQVEKAGVFAPQNSQRSGRGSVTAYPFSWVYTALGYTTTRNFLGITDEGPRPNPIPTDNLPNAGILLRAMFGDRSKGLSSSVDDSRELGDLAAVLASPEKIALLESGLSIATITRVTRPIEERLRRNLTEIRALQSELLSGLAEEPPEVEAAMSHLSAATAARRQSQAIERALTEVMTPNDAD